MTNSGELSWSFPFVMLMTPFFISGNTFQSVSDVLLSSDEIPRVHERCFLCDFLRVASIYLVRLKIQGQSMIYWCNRIRLRFRWLALLSRRFENLDYLFCNYFNYNYKSLYCSKKRIEKNFFARLFHQDAARMLHLFYLIKNADRNPEARINEASSRILRLMNTD